MHARHDPRFSSVNFLKYRQARPCHDAGVQYNVRRVCQLHPDLRHGDPTGPMLNGKTYIVRPCIAPLKSALSFFLISKGFIQLLWDRPRLSKVSKRTCDLRPAPHRLPPTARSNNPAKGFRLASQTSRNEPSVRTRLRILLWNRRPSGWRRALRVPPFFRPIAKDVHFDSEEVRFENTHASRSFRSLLSVISLRANDLNGFKYFPRVKNCEMPRRSNWFLAE